MSNNKETNNPFDIFIRGARKGFTLATQNLLPNVLMAYTLAELLRILGIMAFLGNLFAPAMALFGLPGESVTILLTAWLSYSAGIGVAVNLLSNNTLDSWIRKGLPIIRIGKTVRFDKTEINRWLQNQ